MTTYFSGFASRFNMMDLAADMIMPGAFAQTLKARPHGAVRMLYQHDLTRPIGRWLDLRETSAGLWVEGVLTDEVRLSKDVGGLLRNGILDGLSIGFRVRKAETGKGRVRRRLVELELVEISIVTFPMQPHARIKGVTLKQATGPVSQILDASQKLRAITRNPKGTIS